MIVVRFRRDVNLAFMMGDFWCFVLYECLKRCCFLYDSGLVWDFVVHLLVLMDSYCCFMMGHFNMCNNMMRHFNMFNNMMVWSVRVFSLVVLHWLVVRIVGIVLISVSLA